MYSNWCHRLWCSLCRISNQ